ncbi:MAG: hypothetical protein GY772_13995 [bacterium]|nr:hypothetical protein [bacterium]
MAPAPSCSAHGRALHQGWLVVVGFEARLVSARRRVATSSLTGWSRRAEQEAPTHLVGLSFRSRR